MSSGAGQKTEKPTPRRLREARRKGQIPRSVDVVQWFTLLAASFVLPSTIRAALDRIDGRLGPALRLAGEGDLDSSGAILLGMSGSVAVGLAPLLGLVMVSSIVGMAAQGGLVISGHPVKPQWSRVSPKAGFKRIFSLQSVMESAKAVTRLGVLLVLVATTLVTAAGQHLFGAGLGLGASTALLVDQLLLVLRLAALVGTVIGLADVAFQRWQAMRRLKMSKQEVKEDLRSSEGDPVIRSRRRAAHAQLTRNQMLRAVADASVVVVNPTHYAVALTYRAGGSAPELVAKGTDELAWRIRERAVAAEVPLVESPPLARALHASVDVGQPIPAEFYEAVAIVLAFVMRRRRNRAGVPRRVVVPASKIPTSARPEARAATATDRAARADGATTTDGRGQPGTADME